MIPRVVEVRSFGAVHPERKDGYHKGRKLAPTPKDPDCIEWADHEIGRAINLRLMGFFAGDIAGDIGCTVAELRGLFRQIRHSLVASHHAGSTEAGEDVNPKEEV